MTTAADFTQEEWEIIRDAPLFIGTAMALMTDSGLLSTLFEVMKAAVEIVDIRDEFPDNQLLHALVAESEVAKEKRKQDAQQLFDVQSGEERPRLALERARLALDLLSQKATAQEIEEYKQLLRRTSEKVANALKEGGFFGIGGTRVSASEKYLLDGLEELLGSTG